MQKKIYLGLYFFLFLSCQQEKHSNKKKEFDKVYTSPFWSQQDVEMLYGNWIIENSSMTVLEHDSIPAISEEIFTSDLFVVNDKYKGDTVFFNIKDKTLFSKNDKLANWKYLYPRGFHFKLNIKRSDVGKSGLFFSGNWNVVKITDYFMEITQPLFSKDGQLVVMIELIFRKVKAKPNRDKVSEIEKYL